MILKTSVKPWRACNRCLSFAGEGLAAQAKGALKPVDCAAVWARARWPLL